MGIQHKSVMGIISGSAGTVIGQNFKGIPVVRTRNRNVNLGHTNEQFAQRFKMFVAREFYTSVFGAAVGTAFQRDDKKTSGQMEFIRALVNGVSPIGGVSSTSFVKWHSGSSKITSVSISGTTTYTNINVSTDTYTNVNWQKFTLCGIMWNYDRKQVAFAGRLKPFMRATGYIQFRAGYFYTGTPDWFLWLENDRRQRSNPVTERTVSTDFTTTYLPPDTYINFLKKHGYILTTTEVNNLRSFYSFYAPTVFKRLGIYI